MITRHFKPLVNLVEPDPIPQPLINKAFGKKEMKPGETVDIKRSNGRVHSSLIYDVQLDTGMVYVKFFEGVSMGFGDVV